MNAYISRFLVGAVVFGAGVVLLLDSLNIIDTGSLVSDWWPILIIIGGIAIMISDTKNYLWAAIVVLFGVVAQLQVLGYTDVSPWQIIWPLVLIVIGILITFKRPTTIRSKQGNGESDDIVAILSGSDHKSVSNDFTESEATAVLGGVKIDLRKATIKKSATIRVFSLMGGIEIILPRTIIVKNQTNAILGAVENKTDQDTTKDSPVLTIVGDVILGGVEIKN